MGRPECDAHSAPFSDAENAAHPKIASIFDDVLRVAERSGPDPFGGGPNGADVVAVRGRVADRPATKHR